MRLCRLAFCLKLDSSPSRRSSVSKVKSSANSSWREDDWNVNEQIYPTASSSISVCALARSERRTRLKVEFDWHLSSINIGTHLVIVVFHSNTLRSWCPTQNCSHREQSHCQIREQPQGELVPSYCLNIWRNHRQTTLRRQKKETLAMKTHICMENKDLPSQLVRLHYKTRQSIPQSSKVGMKMITDTRRGSYASLCFHFCCSNDSGWCAPAASQQCRSPILAPSLAQHVQHMLWRAACTLHKMA